MNEQLSTFAKVKLLFTQPSVFWEKIESEKGIGQAIKYLWTLIPNDKRY